MSYQWPENLTELKGVIKRIVSSEKRLEMQDLLRQPSKEQPSGSAMPFDHSEHVDYYDYFLRGEYLKKIQQKAKNRAEK